MHGKFFLFIKTTWGKLLAILGAIVLLFTFTEYVLKWNLYNKLAQVLKDNVLSFLMQPVRIPTYLAVIMSAASILYLYVIFLKFYKPKEFYIEIKDRYHTGYPPNDYARKTKWNFKNYQGHYFVPLLVHSYNDVSYEEFCGPYCSKCNHLLHLKGTGSENVGSIFECINCSRKYRIPKELRNNWTEKLDKYFAEEMRQGRLKQNN
jgi:hypothetical protein